MHSSRTGTLVVTAMTVAALAACSTTAAPGQGSPDPRAGSDAAASSSVAGRASHTSQPTPDERPLQNLLPAEFRGVEAHTFPVGQDMLERLALAIGIRRRALEVAYASDHGPAFVQMFAVRAPGGDPLELLEALPHAAYPDAADGAIIAARIQLGDHRVTAISDPSAASSIGSFYAQVDGRTLIVAQSFAEPVAEAAFDERTQP